jgi:predicted DNA-binding protein (MmcQ/YjbR family)
MTPAGFREAALALPAATFDVKWESNHVFSVGDRMFAMIWTAGEPRYAFKASDMAYEFLIDQGLAKPAPYLWRARWVQLVSADALPYADLAAYLKQAHAIVAAKLTRKRRIELGVPV